MIFAEPNRDKEPDRAEPSDWESPHHGFQGNRQDQIAAQPVPALPTLAISREAGSRGGSIARRVGEQLGWQVYDHELLNYIAQDADRRDSVFDSLPLPAAQWAERQLNDIRQTYRINQDDSLANLAGLVVALGAQGGIVLVGRAAGYLLSPQSTLHVRIMAPLADRVAYLAEWLRLTEAEAAEQVRIRDQQRLEFLSTRFGHRPGDVYGYDLLLNSSRLGEELCARLLVHAVRARFLVPDEVDAPDAQP